MRTPSLFSSVVRDGVTGKVRHRALYRPNERTNAGINQQANQMGQGPGATGTGMTAITATSASLTGLAGTLNQYAGMWLVAYGASGTLTAIARILSNTAATPTVVTIDAWQDGAGTTVTTPVTGTWHILEGGHPLNYLALSSTVFATDVTVTTLAGEFSVAGGTGLDRKKGTFAHTLNATSYTLNKLFTAAGAGGTVNQEGVFGAATALIGGIIGFRSAEPTPPALLAGDTLNQTVTVNF